MHHAIRSILALLVSVSAPLAACSSGGDTTPTSTGTGGHGGSTGAGGTGGCASGLLCGQPALCCAAGDECVGGACAPACPSGVRCSGACCSSGEVCVSGACQAPAGPCKDSFDCADNQYCEPTLNQCLQQPPGGTTCQYHPAPLPFAPIIEWSWTGSTIHPGSKQVATPPVVIDLDGDEVPEVIVVSYETTTKYDSAYLRALDGATGQEKWAADADVYQPENQVGQFGAAAGDLDGDGKPEIVAGRRGGGLIAFRGDGSLLWTSTHNGAPWNGLCGFNHGEKVFEPSVVIADMDADGTPEIVGGGVVFDAHGHVLSGIGHECAGDNQGYAAPVSIVADVDSDGVQDILCGNAAYRLDGSTLWTSPEADGYTAVSDLDGDGTPELIVISGGRARVHDATTGALLASLEMPGQGRGGAPTVADFDNDGVMEFSSANGDDYSVFEYVPPPGAAILVKWSQPTQDLSSNCTGSSVFDFEADGAAEVLYNDECYFRVYSGKDGAVLFQEPSSTGTAVEYPVVVDVDGDHNTEIVVVSNDNGHLTGGINCPYQSGELPRHGVFVYGDSHDKWVRTRRVWNQHAYHITNIGVTGAVPSPEPSSWGPLGFNNYRVSSQGADVYNAPDLQVDLGVTTAGCPATIGLVATVQNKGSLGVPPGVEVAFFGGVSPGGQLLGAGKTKATLLPGGSEVVTTNATLAGQSGPPYAFYVVVDGANPADSTVDECLEDNNQAAIGEVACSVVR